ncbi:hypothetical protein STTU_p0029 (plasmid) [Streptomyces sp. Tu6071]|nr:hypothetical protein STTU_p0029 [Streptomyces sp. Tu6071]
MRARAGRRRCGAGDLAGAGAVRLWLRRFCSRAGQVFSVVLQVGVAFWW